MKFLMITWPTIEIVHFISTLLLFFLPRALLGQFHFVYCILLPFLVLTNSVYSIFHSFSELFAPRMAEVFDIPKCFLLKHFNDLTLMKWLGSTWYTRMNAKQQVFFAVIIIEIQTICSSWSFFSWSTVIISEKEWLEMVFYKHKRQTTPL